MNNGKWISWDGIKKAWENQSYVGFLVLKTKPKPDTCEQKLAKAYAEIERLKKELSNA